MNNTLIPDGITLSRAILKGAAMRPQEVGSRHGLDGSCVLGAIEDAFGYERDTQWDESISAEKLFPALLTLSVVNPENGTDDLLNRVMADLNNGNTNYSGGPFRAFTPWSRERLAEWIAATTEAGA